MIRKTAIYELLTAPGISLSL